MKPIIALYDADLWCYDIPFAAQRNKDGVATVLSFEYCKRLVDQRFLEIQEKLQCVGYEMYLTGTGNFRHALATIQEYKSGRPERPFHYQNVLQYLKFRYNAKVINGMEADDYLSVRQRQLGNESVIVTRDKDLRMVPGWHYSYPLSNQKEKPLEYIQEFGYLDKTPSGVIGGGLMWFYFQCITGDRVDSIQGIPGAGPAMAYKTLKDLTTEQELHNATYNLYKNKFGESAEKAFKENAQLLWMIAELNEDNPVMWENKYEEEHE